MLQSLKCLPQCRHLIDSQAPFGQHSDDDDDDDDDDAGAVDYDWMGGRGAKESSELKNTQETEEHASAWVTVISSPWVEYCDLNPALARLLSMH